MNKVVQMGKPKKVETPNTIDGVIEAVKKDKKSFIPPKAKMKESIENDANYLVALGQFIHFAQKEVERLKNANKMYEASKVQIEIFDAIGKYQSNQGLINDKSTHFEKVWLPMYEKELQESKEKFEGILNQCKETILNLKSVELQPNVKKIYDFVVLEVSKFEDAEELQKDEEYRNYTYKILKRLYNKLTEELAQSV